MPDEQLVLKKDVLVASIWENYSKSGSLFWRVVTTENARFSAFDRALVAPLIDAVQGRKVNDSVVYNFKPAVAFSAYFTANDKGMTLTKPADGAAAPGAPAPTPTAIPTPTPAASPAPRPSYTGRGNWKGQDPEAAKARMEWDKQKDTHILHENALGTAARAFESWGVCHAVDLTLDEYEKLSQNFILKNAEVFINFIRREDGK